MSATKRNLSFTEKQTGIISVLMWATLIYVDLARPYINLFFLVVHIFLRCFQQMEVPCYTEGKISEFTDQIQKLKGEYRAYLHKLRALDPGQSSASWSTKPYGARKRPNEGDFFFSFNFLICNRAP